jgi:8-oxo-dGTP diphosphatase
MHLRAQAHSTTVIASAQALDFAQKAFIVDDGRLLLVRKSMTDPRHPGRWEVPGGRLDAGVDLDLDDHIRREVWEEVGIKVDPGPPFHLWQWYLPDTGTGGVSRVVAVARVCRPVSVDVTTANQVPGDHIAAAAWVPCDRLGEYYEHLIPDLQPVMRRFLDMRAELPVAATP